MTGRTAEGGTVVALSGQLLSIWTSNFSVGLIVAPLKHWKAHYEIAVKKRREIAINERFNKLSHTKENILFMKYMVEIWDNVS